MASQPTSKKKQNHGFEFVIYHFCCSLRMLILKCCCLLKSAHFCILMRLEAHTKHTTKHTQTTTKKQYNYKHIVLNQALPHQKFLNFKIRSSTFQNVGRSLARPNSHIEEKEKKKKRKKQNKTPKDERRQPFSRGPAQDPDHHITTQTAHCQSTTLPDNRPSPTRDQCLLDSPLIPERGAHPQRPTHNLHLYPHVPHAFHLLVAAS